MANQTIYLVILDHPEWEDTISTIHRTLNGAHRSLVHTLMDMWEEESSFFEFAPPTDEQKAIYEAAVKEVDENPNREDYEACGRWYDTFELAMHGQMDVSPDIHSRVMTD